MDPKAFLTVAIILFTVGMAGFLIRRNLIVVFLALELMLNAGALALLSFGRIHADMGAHVLFFIVIALAAAESAVGLSLVIATYRLKRGVSTDELAEMKG